MIVLDRPLLVELTTCIPSKMGRTYKRIAALLFCLSLVNTLALPVSGQSAEDAFTEAQRYHLGVGRPRDARKAEEFYKKAIRDNPRNLDARYNLAHLYLLQKRYDLAARTYRDVLKQDPEDSDAYNNPGTVYERQGKPKSAVKLYLRATKTKAPVPAAYYNLARIYLEEGDEDKAKLAVERAIALEPENEAFIKLHSKVLGDAGKLSNTTVGLVVGGLVVTFVGGGVVLYKGKMLA